MSAAAVSKKSVTPNDDYEEPIQEVDEYGGEEGGEESESATGGEETEQGTKSRGKVGGGTGKGGGGRGGGGGGKGVAKKNVSNSRRGSKSSKSPGRSASPGKQPDIFRATPNKEESGEGAKVLTSSAPLSLKEAQVLDELAKLFTIQEEKCMREGSALSKTSLTPSTSSLDAKFIYTHVDFQVLGKCVPGFVKTNLNKNCRYLPETFILRVNYWRRRRALGDDSKSKSKEPVARSCRAEHKDKDQKQKDVKKDEKSTTGGNGVNNNGGAGNGSVLSTPRAGSVIQSARSPRPPTVVISS